MYGIINKDMDHAADSRSEYIKLADKVRADCSKVLDTTDLSPEQKHGILDREIEILRIVDKKDSEIRSQEQGDIYLADKKDSEKRMFNWKTIGTAGILVLASLGVFRGIGSAMLEGKLDLKLPPVK